jgi:hypothetical protein
VLDDGAPPSYIDRSYVASEFQKLGVGEMVDNRSGEEYLIQSAILTDERDTPYAVIIAGKSFQTIKNTIAYQNNFLLLSGLAAGGLLVFLSIYLNKNLISHIDRNTNRVLEEATKPKYITPSMIRFDSSAGAILIDTHRVKIQGGKQIDLCSALFSHPTKKWAHDELMDRLQLQEHDVNKRTFYDAKIAINQKIKQLLGESLITYENKSFALNQKLTPLIKK